MTPVSKDMTYTAVYASGFVVPVIGENTGLDVKTESGAYVLSIDAGKQPSFSLANLIFAARTTGREIYLQYTNGVSILMKADSLANIDTSDGVNAEIKINFFDGADFSCEFSLTNSSGKQLFAPGTQIQFRSVSEVDSNYKGKAAAKVSSDAADYTEHEFLIAGSTWTFITDNENIAYAIFAIHTVEQKDSQNGQFVSNLQIAAAGDRVTLNVYPEYGFMLDKITVKTASGDEIAVSDTSFIMPDSDVTVSVTFKVAVYTIRFYVDGALYSESTYRHGDTVVIPDAPEKESENGIAFTFSGWSPSVITTALANAEYNGTFSESPIAGKDYVKSPYTKILPTWFIVLLIVLVIGIGGAVSLIIIKRIKKQKAAAAVTAAVAPPDPEDDEF